MLKIVCMASGEGTNVLAIHQACISGIIKGKIVGIITDNNTAAFPILKKAEALHIPAVTLTYCKGDRKQWANNILLLLKVLKPDIICLAGFMKILDPIIVHNYVGRIINLHPGILPELAGKDPQKKALDLNLRETGNTIHIVTDIVDDHSIILATDKVMIDYQDSELSLSTRLKEVGYSTYITAINKWINNKEDILCQVNQILNSKS